jgi:SNF2 family DNA or RNA helicase
MGYLLERIHNVQERGHERAPKRQKVDSDDEVVITNKAQFMGGGHSSSILGTYVKEKQEEGRKERVATQGTAPAVDLTADDSDVVELADDPMDREVCYGRIEGADVNCFRVPTPREGTRALSNEYWPHVKVVLKRRTGDKTSIISVVDSTRQCIGSLDVNTACGLVPILDSNLKVRTAARILTRQKKSSDLPPGAECSQRFPLDLTLYGPEKHAKQIGKFLSQKQLWLRLPLSVEAGIKLVNPHTALKIAQAKPGVPRCLGSYSTSSAVSMRTVEQVRDDVIGLFDTLQQAESLEPADPGPLIVTKLLPHQAQGLRFMQMKERERKYFVDPSGKGIENVSTWNMRIGPNGTKSYYNVITGEEQREPPPQVLGGILADMMGLGKTLSILSLVCSSLDQAEQWGRQPPPPRSGEDEVPLKRNVKTTLLISPLSTISNWEEQIHQHVKDQSLKYHIYHGDNRIRDIDELAEFDLVITTYGSVSSEFNRRGKKAGPFPLEEINWFRIVLDEAHMIREQSTLQSRAVCRLQAQRRWAVTGTPVQNKLDDLGALIKFLRVKPFDEKRQFAQWIVAPCKNADADILPKLRLLVDSLTLRRLKDKIHLPPRHDEIVYLKFSPEEQELYDIFSKNAQDRVKVLTASNDRSASGVALGGRTYVHILQSILRLRLICAHGRELLGEEDLKILSGVSQSSAIELEDSDDDNEEKPALTPMQAYDAYNLMRNTAQNCCGLCSTSIKPKGDEPEKDSDECKDETVGYVTPCFHLVCPGCVKEYKAQLLANSDGAGKNATAPCYICKQTIRIDVFPLKASKIGDEVSSREPGSKRSGKVLGAYHGPHTKTRRLLEELINTDIESAALPAGEPPLKSVVFSGWTSHLDLIGHALTQHQLPYVRLDGSMSRGARTAALDTFRLDPTIRVILVSLSAGGLGLNLTAASRVYVMEPQYNPAAEAQAVDRIHRLGQTREVWCKRFVMEASFEGKMLELQEKKRRLARLATDRVEKGAFRLKGVGKEEAMRKRLEELKVLFK